MRDTRNSVHPVEILGVRIPLSHSNRPLRRTYFADRRLQCDGATAICKYGLFSQKDVNHIHLQHLSENLATFLWCTVLSKDWEIQSYYWSSQNYYRVAKSHNTHCLINKRRHCTTVIVQCCRLLIRLATRLLQVSTSLLEKFWIRHCICRKRRVRTYV